MKPYTRLLTELVTAGEEVRSVGLHVAHLRQHVDMTHLQVPVTGNCHQVTLNLARCRHVTCKQYPAKQIIITCRASAGQLFSFLTSALSVYQWPAISMS